MPQERGRSTPSNRLILPDDPKLAVVAGAPSDGISLSVRGRNFRKAVFDRSNLVRVDFSAADLRGASLRGTRLEGAKFECAGSAIVVFHGPAGAYDAAFSPHGNYVCANLNSARLAYAQLDRSSFDGAQLNGADLDGTTVTNADFSHSKLSGAQFRGAVGRGVKFSRAHLIAANFNNAQLFAADFQSAYLQGARLSFAYLQAANFRESSMQGIDASGASLQGAIFDRTFLQTASFLGARLQGATFNGAALTNALLTCITAFRTDFENSDRLQTVTADRRCDDTGWYDVGYDYSPDDPVDIAYRLPSDKLPTPPAGFDPYRWGYYPGYTDYSSEGIAFEFLNPEKLDDGTFTAILNQSTADLSEDAKMRVTEVLKRLRPSARIKAQDNADKLFWTNWAKQSAPRESHESALAARLEFIACVAENAPYVARGLLLARRFDRLYEGKEAAEREKQRIYERFRNESGGGNAGCPGTRGLVEADFIARGPGLTP
jgi:uncharacterized protein YjbI with pentapeptide repeats